MGEFCDATGYRRMSAVRALNRQRKEGSKKRSGRPPLCRGGELMSALLLAWEASGFTCGKYLAAGMGALPE